MMHYQSVYVPDGRNILKLAKIGQRFFFFSISSFLFYCQLNENHFNSEIEIIDKRDLVVSIQH